MDPSTVWGAVKRFEEGNVAAKKNKGNSKLTTLELFSIIECVLNNSAIYLCEIQQNIESVIGTVISESAICRFLQRNNFSHKKLSRIAAQRSLESREEFWLTALYIPLK